MPAGREKENENERRAADGLTWEQIEEEARRRRDAEQRTQQEVTDRVDARSDGAYDRSRLTLKETLRLLAAEGGAYERAANGDPELKEIVGLAREYAAYEVTAIAGDYEGEVASFRKLCGKLDGYLEKQEELQYTEASDSPEAQARYLAATELSHLVAPQRFGNLDPEREALRPGAVIVDGVTPTFVTGKDDRQIRYPNDQPLFPHDPSPNDISQGALGNCYMLAGLSTVASLAPEKIKDSMRDNGDGTVTVRFYHKQKDKTTGEFTGFTPVLVTVEKVAPDNGGSQDCLWVQMMERAYVASGLHLDHNPDAEPVPADLDRKYREFSAMPEKDRPGREEYPWLFDLGNRLTPWKPDYSSIEAGQPGGFLEQFLGSDAPYETVYPQQMLLAVDHRDPIGFDGGDPVARAIYNEWEGKPKAKTSEDSVSSVEMVRVLEDIRDPAYVLSETEKSFGSILTTVMMMLNTDHGELGEKHPGKGMRAILTDMKKVFTGPAESCPESVRSMYAELALPKYDEMRKKGLATLEKLAPTVIDRAMRSEPYGGAYSTFEKQLRQRIDDTIRAGGIVNAGTPGKTDRNEVDGIYNRHGYSVLGTVEKQLSPDTEKLTFVRVRNPHGHHGREYYVEDGEVKQRSTENAEGGVFLVELSDFCREYHTVDFTDLDRKIGFAAPKAPQKAAQPQAGAQKTRLEGDVFRRYTAELHRAYGDLEDTKKGILDSFNTEFFNNLERSLKSTLTDDLHTKMRGRELITAGYALDCTHEASLYVKHAADESKGKPLSGRRAARAAIAERIGDLGNALLHEYDDPAEYCRHQIAEKIYRHLRDAQLEKAPDPAAKAEISRVFQDAEHIRLSLDAIRASAAFTEMTGGKDFAALSALSHDPKMIRRFSELQVKVAAEAKKKAPAAQPGAAREAGKEPNAPKI